MESSLHIPVMMGEVLNGLRAAEGGSFIDCTLGGGGHSSAILEANQVNRVFAFDRDGRAVARAGALVERYVPRLTVRKASFSELRMQEIPGPCRGVLADLGISTDQLREQRGFSFNDRGSLDMRMDEEQPVIAADVVNTFGEPELQRLLTAGGVSPRDARQVVRAIVTQRPFADSAALSAAINQLHLGERNKNPSTVVFQALRIFVNSEFAEIEALLRFVPTVAGNGTRCVVISFHSLEDKIVARAMREWEAGDDRPALWRGKGPDDGRRRLGRLLTRKALQPTSQECEENPSARSARLRIFEFEMD